MEREREKRMTRTTAENKTKKNALSWKIRSNKYCCVLNTHTVFTWLLIFWIHLFLCVFQFPFDPLEHWSIGKAFAFMRHTDRVNDIYMQKKYSHPKWIFINNNNRGMLCLCVLARVYTHCEMIWLWLASVRLFNVEWKSRCGIYT